MKPNKKLKSLRVISIILTLIFIIFITAAVIEKSLGGNKTIFMIICVAGVILALLVRIILPLALNRK